MNVIEGRKSYRSRAPSAPVPYRVVERGNVYYLCDVGLLGYICGACLRGRVDDRACAQCGAKVAA